MNDVVISVHNLGKRYRIGTKIEELGNIREAIVNIAKAPIRNFKKLRKLTHFADAEQDEANDVIWALKDITFEVKKGEVVGIIGRNGAGKSTLLKILTRITEPTKGYAEIKGRVSSLLEVGTGFHPELSGRENVYLNGSILGMKKWEIDQKFDEIVGFAEVEKFIDTPVKRYSSGMKVRLAFAVAAHLEPEILLIDEVLAVGDVVFQKKCLGKMSKLAKGGRTVLFVSHNMNAIEQLCESCLLLEKGHKRIISQDVRSVIKKYLFQQEDENTDNEWINRDGEFSNPWFKPLRFFIADQNGKKQSMPLSNNSNMWIQIEGEIKEIDPALTVGYAIFNENGTLLYWSCHADGPEDIWPQLKKGPCALRGKIPSRFLNEGTYKIELIASLHFRKWLCKPGVHAPAIYLNIQGGLSDSPYWMAKRPGIVAPVLEWESIKC